MQVVFDFAQGLIGDEEFEYMVYADPSIWDWGQEPEWSFRDNRSILFVSETHDGELFLYHFTDDASDTKITVEQYA